VQIQREIKKPTMEHVVGRGPLLLHDDILRRFNARCLHCTGSLRFKGANFEIGEDAILERLEFLPNDLGEFRGFVIQASAIN
jgi:hypothetical protein